MIRVCIFISICFLFAAACSKSGGGGPAPLDCTTVPKSYIANVDPIIQSFCNATGCHATGSTNGPGPLTNHAQVAAAKISIRAAIQSGTMPQNATLTTAQKNSILCWIDAGALNN